VSYDDDDDEVRHVLLDIGNTRERERERERNPLKETKKDFFG
jgi:hypothetical protein